jgi:hypothetical protein
MFDRDRDEEISKKDLFRMFMIERDGMVVFPFNNMRAVELVELDRGDKINKHEFVDIIAQVPYIVFPAFRLQASMKEVFAGNRFWKKCKVKLEKKELEKKIIAEREKFLERNKRKKELEY